MSRHVPRSLARLFTGLLVIGPLGAVAAGAEAHHHPVPSAAWAIPFAALLLSIAILPLVPRAHEWWEHNRNKLLVGLGLGAVVLAHYAWRGFGFHEHPPGLASVAAVLRHALIADYLPFMTLLFSLYVISGGLQLRGDLRALPGVNTGLLGLGALLASLVGTTGASMVLIRPLLQTNHDRRHVRHTVVFFIFLVSNIGGCLLPIGDPPLFLGYLKGVPFLWTVGLILPWFCGVTCLLVVYYVWDRLAFAREAPGDRAAEMRDYSPPRLRGAINLVWLLGVVLAVALIPSPSREAAMLALAVLSLATTPRGLRRETEFTYGAIAEVASLFLGIFLTMQVPIEILQAHGPSLGLNSPAQFFWATGGLSSFLDNAPTYVVFFETARTLPIPSGAALLPLADGPDIRHDLLAAISLGAVFMGANTYIGNGPNFMVKSIAEQHGVRMPSFFGYMLYSGAILLPLFLVISYVFFS